MDDVKLLKKHQLQGEILQQTITLEKDIKPIGKVEIKQRVNDLMLPWNGRRSWNFAGNNDRE